MTPVLGALVAVLIGLPPPYLVPPPASPPPAAARTSPPPPPAAPASSAAAPAKTEPAAVPRVDVAPQADVVQGSGQVLLPGATIQRSPRIHRGGSYLGFGTGFGFSDYATKSFAGSGAALFGVRAGAIVGDQLLFGPEVLLSGQFNKWGQAMQVGTGLSSVMMEAMVFPWSRLPLNLSAGAGWASGIRVDRLNKSGDHTPVQAAGDEGLSYMVSAGWDLAPGPGSNFGLQLRYDGSHFFKSDVTAVQGFSLGIWLNTY